MSARPSFTVAIDTEEDNWGSFSDTGETTRNIDHLVELHERMARHGARPTYLVNRAPLMFARSVEILGTLASRPEVEIGTHCHPWNTPPSTGEGAHRSMMCNLPLEANRAKLREVTQRIQSELGVRPRTFRAGRWGFGPTVAEALAAEGYRIDASVSPLIDWSHDGGPDFTSAPLRPYRFDPKRPLQPDPHGSMVEIPTTVAFTKGDLAQRAELWRRLVKSGLRRFKIMGVLDRLGLMQRRWMSPETSTVADMIRLGNACQASGEPVIGVTFHSCCLLPGATPFVRDATDRERFLAAIEEVLRAFADRVVFRTLSETTEAVFRDQQSS